MSAGRKRILCVDDNLDTCELFKKVLNLAQYEAVTIHTATEAIARARVEPFDLYLLDKRLPDVSGLDLCRGIRAFDPHTPIIFISALARAGDIEAGMSAGANAYFTKPVDPIELVRKIRKLLQEDCNGEGVFS